MSEAATVSDADMLSILKGREYARAAAEQFAPLGLNPFHAGHAFVAEGMSRALGLPIEAARTITNTMLSAFIGGAAAELARIAAEKPAEASGETLVPAVPKPDSPHHASTSRENVVSFPHPANGNTTQC